jgi:predicted secreted protein
MPPSKPDLFRFAWYVTYTCAILSGLYLAEMSTDRLIAVRFPMAAPRLCTTSRAHKTVIITTILIAALDLNIFFTYQYIRDPETGKVEHFSPLFHILCIQIGF